MDPQTGKGIAGVVVLYHPKEDVLSNIRSYAPWLDLLVVVDNTPEPFPWVRERISGLANAVYIANGANRGIAVAQNQGAKVAREKGMRWLLTMDQDSSFEGDAFCLLVKAAERHPGFGIICARHALEDGQSDSAATGVVELRTAMASGNLLNLAAYQNAGPFREDYFIDYVDHEFCLRLRRKGYRILRVNSARLNHSLGNLVTINRFGLRFRPTHHSPIRRYYMTRNRLAMMRRYPEALASEAFAWSKELVKLLLFEDEKARKLRYIALGFLHFLKGKRGPLDGHG